MVSRTQQQHAPSSGGGHEHVWSGSIGDTAKSSSEYISFQFQTVPWPVVTMGLDFKAVSLFVSTASMCLLESFCLCV